MSTYSFFKLVLCVYLRSLLVSYASPMSYARLHIPCHVCLCVYLRSLLVSYASPMSYARLHIPCHVCIFCLLALLPS